MYTQENILQAAKQKSALIPFSWAVSVLLGTLRTTESPADPGDCPREAGGGRGGGHTLALACLTGPPVFGVGARRSFCALRVVVDVAPSSARGLVDPITNVSNITFLPCGHCCTLLPRRRSTARCIHNSLGRLHLQNVDGQSISP